MKYRLLDFIACPLCKGELQVEVVKEEEVALPFVFPSTKEPCKKRCYFRVNNCELCLKSEIREGVLRCSCGQHYQIMECIPVLLPTPEFTTNGDSPRVSKESETMPFILRTQKSFGYEWLRYESSSEREEEAVFLSDSQLAQPAFQGKLVLDAGCGMGRFTRLAGMWGSEVIGIDFSESVRKAYHLTRGCGLVHIMQGDLLKLPLREKQFDIIYSLGVLHHTPCPKHAFINLTHCLKKGGIISLWVYGKAGNFKDFTTNPLRDDRVKYLQTPLAKKTYWFIVLVREVCYQLIRMITTRMPIPFLYAFCYVLAAVGTIPYLKYLTASTHHRFTTRVQENFDWFSPAYQSHHTKEEVRGWFEEVGFTDLSLLRHGFIPKVGLRGKLR